MKLLNINLTRSARPPPLQLRAGQPRPEPTARQRLIWNLDKLGTNLEQNLDATNDRSDAKIHPKFSKNPSREAPRDIQNRSQHCPRAPSIEGKTHGGPKMAKKSRKSAESRSKMASLGPKWDPKIDKKTTRSEKSDPQDGAGSGFHRFLAPSSFGIAFQLDFGRV